MDVLIVEDHALVREGLRMMLDGMGIFERCIECASIAAALAEVRVPEASFGLVLLDLGLPDAQGLDALDRLQKACPAVPILVVSGGDDASIIDEAFACGARGYVPKNSSGPALRSAVDMVLRGELYVPPHVLPSLTTRLRHSSRPALASGTVARLTPRQSEVLVLLAAGLTNKEIGERLSMSPSTVRAHVSAILKELGVDNRTQAATSAAASALLGARGTDSI